MAEGSLGFGETKGFDFELSVLPNFEPDDHGVLIALLGHILKVPLAISLIYLKRTGFLGERGRKVTQFEAAVVVHSSFYHADMFAFVEGKDITEI